MFEKDLTETSISTVSAEKVDVLRATTPQPLSTASHLPNVRRVVTSKKSGYVQVRYAPRDSLVSLKDDTTS